MGFINHGEGHTLNLYFCCLILGIIVLLIEIQVTGIDEHKPSSIMRYYEDGSGRLQFSNGYCTIPAFDSPEDKIECTITKEGS